MCPLIAEYARVPTNEKGGRLLNKMFAPKEEKITEKAFSQSLLVSVLSIILCLVALFSITYAWFTADLSSGGNVLESSRFALEVYVTDGEGNAIPVEANQDGSFTCHLVATGRYTVTLRMTEDTTATKGYCNVTVNSEEKKQTAPISKDPAIGAEPFVFTLEATEENTIVRFAPHWGLPANEQIFHAPATDPNGEGQGES